MRRVDSKTTFEMIYREVGKVNERLTIIEEVIEEVLIRGLPDGRFITFFRRKIG